ncbi:MAG: terminase small subunit [Bacilli bacterium]|nr:terminase small subunit [Bacilli bacterium]
MPRGRPKNTTKNTSSLNDLVNYEFDLDSYPWKNPKLTQKEKLFVFYSSTLFNNSEAARRAGYAEKSAFVTGNKLSIKLKEEIDAFKQKLIKTNIKQAAEQIMRMKSLAATYDPSEFYENKVVYTKSGDPIKIDVMKPLEDIPEEMRRACITGIQSGRDGTNFSFVSKEKAQADILNHNRELNGDQDKNEFDVQLTLEGIKNTVTANIKVANVNKGRAEKAAEIDTAENSEDEL